MIGLPKKIINQTDELIDYAIRPSLVSFLGKIMLAILLVNLPFFLIYPLFQFGLWGVVAFFILLLISIWFLVRCYLEYYYTVFLITDKRLIDIDQKGFLSRSVNTIPFGKINDVSAKTKGMTSMIFKLGDIYITFMDNHKEVVKLSGIKHPYKVVDKIISQREEYMAKKRQLSSKKAITLLKKIKRKLGEDKFNQLISD